MANTKKKTVTAEEVKEEVVENVGKIVEEIQEEEALEKNGATVVEHHVFWKCKFCNRVFPSRAEMKKHVAHCRLNPENEEM